MVIDKPSFITCLEIHLDSHLLVDAQFTVDNTSGCQYSKYASLDRYKVSGLILTIFGIKSHPQWNMISLTGIGRKVVKLLRENGGVFE
jgi:hypothetical protein